MFSALWKSMDNIFPGVTGQGCHFHQCQAVYRQLSTLGLRQEYVENEDIRKVVKRLFALALLPKEHIVGAFYFLRDRADELGNHQLDQLVNYFQPNWLESRTFPVSSWSVYRQHIRTNNDIEGWHNRLNAVIPHERPNMNLLFGTERRN